MAADYSLYKNLLREKVINTKAEMVEAERVFKTKRAAYEAALKEDNAFNDAVIRRVK